MALIFKCKSNVYGQFTKKDSSGSYISHSEHALETKFGSIHRPQELNEHNQSINNGAQALILASVRSSMDVVRDHFSRSS